MTKEELNQKCIELQQECNEKQKELRTCYAKERNPVKIGDILTDHYHTIKVEKMSVYGNYSETFMKYVGIELTKQGEPKKRQPIPCYPVYQNSIRFINGKPYKYEEV